MRDDGTQRRRWRFHIQVGKEIMAHVPPLIFQVDMAVGFGEMASVELIPGGSETAVTPVNRAEWVRHRRACLLKHPTISRACRIDSRLPPVHPPVQFKQPWSLSPPPTTAGM